MNRRLWLLGLAGAAFTTLLVCCVVIYRSVLADLPSVTTIEQRMARPTSRILDRHGRTLYEILDAETGKQISLEDDPDSRYGLAGVPDFCVEAALATEDSRFFYHFGVDPIAIARAAWQNINAGGEIVSGGSTLTQQVARNLLLAPSERYERTLRRKVREAWLALQLEWHYSKQEILQIYLNQTYYGYFSFGLEAAAQNFFAKPAAQLSKAECALLAGLVQYPSGYNPFEVPDAAKVRQRTVLRLMVDAGYVAPSNVERIASEPLRYRSRLFTIDAPHFVVNVQDLLMQRLGVDVLRRGGLDVYTTLDLSLQRQAEAAVDYRLASLNCRLAAPSTSWTWLPSGRSQATCSRGYMETQQVKNAGVVVIDVETGEILAMVGSPNYFDPAIEGNVNAALAQRQPGSAIKPFTYAAAMDPEWAASGGLAEPLTAASILPDIPTSFPGAPPSSDRAGGCGSTTLSFESCAGGYIPKNYDLRYHGPVSVREALANSYNIPAVAILQRIGVESLQRIASQAGIGSFTGEYGLALTLGGGEVSLLDLTSAYGVFPREGRRLEPTSLLKVTKRGGSELPSQMRVTVQSPRSSGSPDTRLISPETAYLITDILSDPVARMPAFGENSVLDLAFPAAAKTGTTTDWRDNWTVGYSSTRLVGVWVGNADNSPMEGVTGIDGAGPIWRDVMLAAHHAPPEGFTRPSRIVERSICAPSGLLPTLECPSIRREKFIAGTEPTRPDDQFVRLTIDSATGLRATDSTPIERREQRIYWRLPAQYHEWMDERDIPHPPPMPDELQSVRANPEQSPSRPEIASAPSTDEGLLVLSNPAGSSVYAIHPGIPVERQRVPVGGYVADGERWASLRLIVDGTVLLEETGVSRLEGWWTLESGEHTFWLEGRRDDNGAWRRSEQELIVVE